MNIDPSLWPLSLTVAFALIHVGRMPADHPLRETLASIEALEARAGLTPSGRAAALWRTTYACATGLLAISGLASFATWIGLIG